jgi:conserved oligomeric Golgi complex subunit 6
MAYTDSFTLPHGLPSSLPAISSNKGADLMVLKVASVLSTSYSDNDFRDAIFLADERLARGSAKTRRLLRLDLLREAIDCNGEIIKEMGSVVEVC